MISSNVSHCICLVHCCTGFYTVCNSLHILFCFQNPSLAFKKKNVFVLINALLSTYVENVIKYIAPFIVFINTFLWTNNKVTMILNKSKSHFCLLWSHIHEVTFSIDFKERLHISNVTIPYWYVIYDSDSWLFSCSFPLSCSEL